MDGEESKDEGVKEKIRDLFRRGARQLSRKYRLVGILPEGKTGMQCLEEVDPESARRLQERAEDWAVDEFLRIHGQKMGCVLELSEGEFKEFLWQKNEAWREYIAKEIADRDRRKKEAEDAEARRSERSAG